MLKFKYSWPYLLFLFSLLLLAALNLAAARYEWGGHLANAGTADVYERLAASQQRHQWWLAASFAVLVLELFLFICPNYKKMVRAYSRLSSQQDELAQQKQTIESLADTNELIISGIQAGVWEWNFTNGYERWSPRLYRLLGYEPGALKASFSTFVSTLLHPDDVVKLQQALDGHLSEGRSFREEVRLLHCNGRYRWYECCGLAHRDPAGKPLLMAGSITDIEDRINYRLQVEHNEFVQEEAGKMARLGHWEYNVLTEEMKWSKTLYDIHETDSGNKSILRDRLKSYASEHHELIRNTVERTVVEGLPFDIELRLITEKGNERWVRSIGHPVFGDRGEVVSIRGVYQDIDQQKRKELELLAAREKLSENNRSKDKLLSIMAHDLRGPINNLKALIDMQEEGLMSKDEFWDYLETIKGNIYSLSEGMDNMLYWAMGQLNGFTVRRASVNINTVIDQSVSLYEQTLSRKGIRINRDIPESLCAYADSDHVLLVVRNILNNAIKFSPSGGAIGISAEAGQKNLCLRISDTGVGMNHEELERVLNPDVLYSTWGTGGEKGMGLGLRLCFEVMGRNGGVINIRSSKGEGTTFVLTFPRVVQEEALVE